MGSWTYSAKPTQGYTTQQKTSYGYGQNVLGTQNRIWQMGKTTQVTQIIPKTLDGLPKAKTTFVHTQIVQTKRRMPTQQLQVLGLNKNIMEAKKTMAIREQQPYDQNQFHGTFNSFTWVKMAQQPL